MGDLENDIELLVCTRCRLDGDSAEVPQRPGAALFSRLVDAGMDGVRVTPVECLSNCSRGCTIALRGASRWTYIYGGLKPGTDIATIIEGTRKYRSTPDGVVPWRERPEHFRKNCIARIPPLAAPAPNQGKI